MNYFLTLVPPLVTALFGAVIGAITVHWLTSKRELYNVRRDLRTEYLIQAYRKITNGTQRKELSDRQKDDMESALSDVFLLGESEEVKAAFEFMKRMDEGSGASANEVLTALRNSLRREIGLSSSETNRHFFLRFTRNHDSNIKIMKPNPID